MGNIGNLSEAKARLDKLRTKMQQLKSDLNKACARGDDRQMKKIQNEMGNLNLQIAAAENAVNCAARSIPRRF